MGSWQILAAAEWCRINGCWCVMSPSKEQGGRGQHIPVTSSWDCWGKAASSRQSSEEGEVGNCLYTTLRVAIAAPWSFNLNLAPLSWEGLGAAVWAAECPCLARGRRQRLVERPKPLDLGIDSELPRRYAFSFQREVPGTQISRFLVCPLPKLEEMTVGNAESKGGSWRASLPIPHSWAAQFEKFI